MGVSLLERGANVLAVLQHRRRDAASPVPGQPGIPGAVRTRRVIVVSEPLGDLAGVWNEVPEASYGVVREGRDELRPFAPQPA